MDLSKVAVGYLKKGISVMPIRLEWSEADKKYNKKPLLPTWKQLQKALPLESDVKAWFLNFSGDDVGVGIICGSVSNLVVLDFEFNFDREELKRRSWNLPPTLVAKTPRGGFHYYYRPQTDKQILGNAVKVVELPLDIRGEGGFVGAPPTKGYEWLIKEPLAVVPDWVYEAVKTTDRVDWKEKIKQVIPEGARNDTLTSFVGKVLQKLDTEFWEVAGWGAAKEWDLSHNKPSLSEKEVRATYESIVKTEWARRQGSTHLLEMLSLKELSEKEFPPEEYLVDKLIIRNGINAISGKPKIGKSFLSLYLAICVASGKKFLGEFEVSQGNVLIITKEDPPNLIKKRIKILSANFSLEVYFYTAPDLFLDTDKYIEALTKFIKERGIKLIIIDSFRRIFRGEENSSQVIAEVHNRFKKLQALDTTILFIHHHGKEGYFPRHDMAEKLRGSSDILAMLDSLLIVEISDSGGILKITQAALRADKPLQPFLIEFPNGETPTAEFKFLEFIEPEKEKKNQAKEDIFALLKTEGEMYQQQIIGRLKPGARYGETTVKEALAEAVSFKRLNTRREGNKVYYSVNEPNKKESESRSIYSNDKATYLYVEPAEDSTSAKEKTILEDLPKIKTKEEMAAYIEPLSSYEKEVLADLSKKHHLKEQLHFLSVLLPPYAPKDSELSEEMLEEAIRTFSEPV